MPLKLVTMHIYFHETVAVLASSLRSDGVMSAQRLKSSEGNDRF